MPRIGAFYAGFQPDEREQRVRDIPKLAAIGFDWLATPLSDADPNCLKSAQVAKDNGIKVLCQPNALLPAQFGKFAALGNVDGVNIQDDAHGVEPAEIIKKRDAWKTVSPNTFITCSKGMHEKYFNLTPWIGQQAYTWKEANWLKRWYWEDVQRIRAGHNGRVVVHPWLGLNAIPYALRDRPDWNVWDREYTPVAQQECAMWLALCAGADDFCFYTAYEMANEGGLAYPGTRSYILERPIWCEQYKAVFRQLRRYEKYLAGTRARIEVGTVLGATWTLGDGSGLRVTVDVESEVFPRLRFDTFQPPAPPVKTNVVITSTGPVTVEAKP